MLLNILIAAFPTALLLLAMVAEGLRRRHDARSREVVQRRPSSAISDDKSIGVRVKTKGVRVSIKGG